MVVVFEVRTSVSPEAFPPLKEDTLHRLPTFVSSSHNVIDVVREDNFIYGVYTSLIGQIGPEFQAQSPAING